MLPYIKVIGIQIGLIFVSSCSIFEDIDDIDTAPFHRINNSCSKGSVDEYITKNNLSYELQFFDNFSENRNKSTFKRQFSPISSSDCYDNTLLCLSELDFTFDHPQNVNCFERNDPDYRRQNLQYLNKCIWHIFDGYSSWTRNTPKERGVTFSKKNVSIKQDPILSPFLDNWALVLRSGINVDYNLASAEGCGEPNLEPRGEANWRRERNCPNSGGSIVSSYYDRNHPGINRFLKNNITPLPSALQQISQLKKDSLSRYGRYEIKAKSVKSKALYTAIWTLSDRLLTGETIRQRRTQPLKKWSPEIDIWEAQFANQGGENGFQSYHYWSEQANGYDSYLSTTVDGLQQVDKYNIFGVIWRPLKGQEGKEYPETELMLYVNNCVTEIIPWHTLAQAGNPGVPMKTPQFSNSLILSAGFSMLTNQDYPTYEQYLAHPSVQDQFEGELWIDWVKVYQ
jgi:hypothetical protein